MHFTSALPPGFTLALGDTLAFNFGVDDNTLRYTVKKTRRSGLVYLANDNGENREIFEALDMTDSDVSAMAQTAFGYGPTGPKWPRSRSLDFAAQTRLVNAIFAKLAGSAPAPAPTIPAPAPTPIVALAPVVVSSGKYVVIVSLTDAGITITIK